jgi:murein L,D-transpeptidase YafK
MEQIKTLFTTAGISYPPKEIFIRSFKLEEEVELWARNDSQSEFKLIKKYPICMGSGELGPKRRQGDLQVPEGFYHISGFNPASRFHLSLRINYPNESDKILSDKRRPGNDIFIHGSCVTIGCIPIRNDGIKELYIIAVDAKSGGQQSIPVHIFPCRMDKESCNVKMDAITQENPALKKFWSSLKPGYDFFESSRKIPQMEIDEDGYYKVIQKTWWPLQTIKCTRPDNQVPAPRKPDEE